MALYHAHRPQIFGSIIGQKHIVQTITSQISQNKPSHAYLFAGPRGIGKTTTARILAKSLNCLNKKDGSPEPCNSCGSCDEISSSRSIDVIEIDAASHTGVDNVRQNIIENAQFKPTKSRNKIFIIDEVHMLSTAAFNALLKTLEEPPEHVIFILATTEMHKLPVTILSRCQKFVFKKIVSEEMKEHLKSIARQEKIKIEEEVLNRIIKKSEGCVRDAIALLDQIMATGEKKITEDLVQFILPTTKIESQIEFVEALSNKNGRAALVSINQLAKDGTDIYQFALSLTELLRSMMIYKVDKKLASDEIDMDDKLKDKFDEIGASLSGKEIVCLIDMLSKRTYEIKSAPLPQMPIEMLVIEWIGRFEAAEDGNGESGAGCHGTVRDKSIEIKNENKNKNSIKETIAQKVKKIVKKNTVSPEKVRESWNEAISEIEKQHPTLVFLLKMAEICETQNNTITIATQYSFHQEKLMERKCRGKIEEVLSKILDAKMKLRVVVKKNSEVKKQDQELQELASSFGGEIVN